MSDREPRKRKKKKDGQKKEDLSTEEVSFSSKKFHEEAQKDAEPEVEEEIVPHEPSFVARIVFFLLFSLLIVATGAVFIALHGADRSVDIINGMEPSHPEELATHEVPFPYTETEEWKPEEPAKGPVDILNGMEASHSEALAPHEVPFLYTETEDWKPEEPAKEANEEPQLWTGDVIEDEEIILPESLQEEETNLPSEETLEMPSEESLETTEYYTQMPFEEITEQPQAEETEIFDRGEEAIEKEYVENYANDNSQSYYDNDIEVFPITENSIDYETTFSHELAENAISDRDDIQEPSMQTINQQPTPKVESSISSEGVESEPLNPPVEQNTDAEENLRTSSETVGNSQTEPPDSLNAQHTTESSDITREETTSTVGYEQADITNEDDFRIKDELDEIDRIIDKSPGKALKMFEDVLKHHPESPRAHFGKARALDKLSEEQRSNAVLEQAIAAYTEVLHLPDVPDKLYLMSGKKGVERMIFRGFVGKAIQLQLKMANHFPNDVDVRNKLAVSYLLVGRGQQAKEVLKEVLEKDPSNGFAKVHYGFILKTEDNNYPEAIKYMDEGISTREPGVIDGRFYFHLGDALSRTGRTKEAMKIYEDGVKEGVFFSVYQRSLYNVEGLTAKPWWKPQDTPYYSAILKLEEKWQVIRNEAFQLMDDTKSGFVPENEGLRDTGDWKQLDLFARGQKNRNCQRTPITCSLIEKIPDAAGCRRGQVKFSILQPGTHIWAHTGPTNCRLRAHLGLMVPKQVKIRVANETREWQQGRVIMFDDSFEHEVWHDGDAARLVLIVDFWHPDLTARQKATLTPI